MSWEPAPQRLLFDVLRLEGLKWVKCQLSDIKEGDVFVTYYGLNRICPDNGLPEQEDSPAYIAHGDAFKREDGGTGWCVEISTMRASDGN